MKRVLVVIGTRPEAIKLAPVIRAIASGTEDFEVEVCSTGQHAEILDSALSIFGIEVDYQLDALRSGQSLSSLTENLLSLLTPLYRKKSFSMTLVHGDTTTAFVASLVSFYSGVPIGHVEAGLRTHNLTAPFPEEFNRRAISVVADLHFAPTELARTNLLHEGVDSDKIYVVGNTVVDALRLLQSSGNFPNDLGEVRSQFSSSRGSQVDSDFVLITLHRRENLGKNLDQVCEAIQKASLDLPQIMFVFVVHPNPQISLKLRKYLGDRDNVSLLESQPYPRFVHLMSKAKLILTDSGGVQEEAVSLGKKVLVMREASERPEGISIGLIEVAGTDVEVLRKKIAEQLGRPAGPAVALENSVYGDGNASPRVAEIIRKVLYE